MDFKKLKPGKPIVQSILNALHEMQILSVLVEGGPKLLQAFINESAWDEIRVITNEELEIVEGISSPEFQNVQFIKSESFGSDTIRYYKNLKF
jgi:diaminohydroxyphosphoribosylaminopyrimidine deaminase/5-amino-6-(5-phosphoribosylamino)uracil reductase